MIALTVHGSQLDAYQNILLRNIAIPRDLDNLHAWAPAGGSKGERSLPPGKFKKKKKKKKV